MTCLVGCLVLLFFSTVLVAAEPQYAGEWRVNEDKSDYGLAFTFTSEESGLRLTEGGRSYTVRFDGKEYPHPLGGTVRWAQLDTRSWEMTLTQNRKVIGDAIYRLSDDGRTLTTRPKSGAGATLVYRRTSGQRQDLAGAWSLKTASDPTLEVAVADGFDLVVRQGIAQVKANFDGRDYHPQAGPETVRISKIGGDGFSLTVSINGVPVAVDTFTVSADGQTLTQVGGAFAQPPTHAVVYERRQ
jgi:hypothetical protein